MRDRRTTLASALFVTCVLSLTTATRGQAQTPTPTPTPRPRPNVATPVFGADVALVAVPVFVTDKNGKSVGGLTIDDFEVEDGGQKAPIVAFHAIDLDRPSPAVSRPEQAQIPVAVQAESPRQFMLLLDLEFSTPVGVLRGRKAVTDFLRTGLAKGDLVSVATWGPNGLQVLTNFTSDHESASRALDGKARQGGVGSDPLGLSGGFGLLGASPWTQEVADQEGRQAQSEREAYATKVAAFLENISRLTQRLSGLRGRKQLVLLSGGFSETAWNRPPDLKAGAESVPNMARMYRVFRDAARSDVVVHTISLAGIEGPIDVSSRTGLKDSESTGGPPTLLNVRVRDQLMVSGRGTLEALSANTGGRFILPTNNFGLALREVDRISRQSYVVAFAAPEPEVKSDKPRKLRVRVRGKGLHVSHRPEYQFPTLRSEALSAEVVRIEAGEAISKGISGGPLRLHLTTLPYRDPDGKTAVHVVLHLDASALSEGARNSELEVSAYGYAMGERRVLDSMGLSTSVDLSKHGEVIRRSGLAIVTALPLKPGRADLRFFVSAGSSGLTGSIQQEVIVPRFVEGTTLLSAPLFNLPLTGRAALPFQPPGRAHIATPFRIGAEPFIPEARPSLSAGRSREVSVFVWPARGDKEAALDVTAEMERPGEAPKPIALQGAPRVVPDADGFDRYVVPVIGPEAPPGSYTLRLTFRDPSTGQATATEIAVWVEN